MHTPLHARYRLCVSQSPDFPRICTALPHQHSNFLLSDHNNATVVSNLLTVLHQSRQTGAFIGFSCWIRAIIMAEVVNLDLKRFVTPPRKAKKTPAAPFQLLFFTGVRYERNCGSTQSFGDEHLPIKSPPRKKIRKA